MISDSQLYSLAIFLGSAAMLFIVIYHFLEVNAVDSDEVEELKKDSTGVGAVRVKELERN
jgi:oligosaccharyl transferase complex subunit OST4